ncbi:S41 family peptidase [Pedobacter punctiformis]|uniref:S41 family peptidase n=1 Tax=Pedobacter punctiformis TaxID=3004097 RepID=A0ABT4L6X1_9SPHI|nr:S41 family peptidase [Pedobacter sp. HCMS5-2]MCZ4243581.1 S41 family peptidase [Pedobacter sp. HCMS5-2]
MKIRIIMLAALMLLGSQVLMAQNTCGCKNALQNIIKKIESEYPGLEEKTKDKLLYNSFKEQILKEATSANETQCLEILQKYTAFFKDRHIWVVPNEISKPTETNSLANQSLNINLKSFKEDVLKRPNEFEGIWKDETYEVGIKEVDANEYVGFIIKADPKYWKPNEIKFRLHANGNYEYYLQDRSVQKGTYKIHDKSILYFNVLRSLFIRQLPAAKLNTEQIKDKVNEINGFYFKALTPRTSILKLSNFSYQFVETIENLIEKNKILLENSEFLIVDLRDNGGGTDNAYQKLLPYILTNPVRYVGVEYLSTPTLISSMETYKSNIKDKTKHADEISGMDEDLKMLRANPGKFVNTRNKAVVIDTINLELISPKEIIILTNKHVASAGENLILAARQSKKVKIMGTPTSGVLDYASARYFEIGCSNYKLMMPAYRSLRLPDYPIDNIGAQPDIYLDSSVKDWIETAKNYLEN